MSSKRNVLITGSGTGIGKRLINEYCRDEFRVFATVREARFEQLKSELTGRYSEVIPYILDVTDLEQGTQVIQEIESQYGAVDVLINNAGISYRTVVEEMSEPDEAIQMATNYFGPMHLIRKVLPGMRKKKKGHIINVSSVGGMMAMPTMSAYSASKFALEGATESLWYEVKPFGINVTLVRPGFINSNAFRKVKYGEGTDPANENGIYYHHYHNMSDFIEKIMEMTPCTSESAARMIYKTSCMKNPPLRVAGTPDARFFSHVRRILPRRFYHWLLYRSLPGIKTWGKGGSHE
ncbi:MAG: SDR family oxidoreductase [Verrucomicrobia bacterium]|nr:SDR family oxidoreductase [Verrucomicrobiota bacterium]MDA1069346.1 SDR family oxidoreductase [Verrucomicrobiota bacterium]